MSTTRIIVLAGALAAALAGARVGAATRPSSPLAGKTLGPRMDFDFAAHTAPAADAPPVAQVAERTLPARDG